MKKHKLNNKANDSDIGPASGPSFGNDDDFIWVSEISDESLSSFYKDFSKLENDNRIHIIPIIVSSYGGDVATLMGMRDIIKSSPKIVATIGLGKAMSAGACLLAAGTKGWRFASPETSIMIHEVSGGMVGKTSDVAESASVMASLNKKLLTNFAKDCGKSYKDVEQQIKSKKNADWTMSTAEAKRWGVIDKVAVPRIVTHPPQTGIGIPPTLEELRAQQEDSKTKKS